MALILSWTVQAEMHKGWCNTLSYQHTTWARLCAGHTISGGLRMPEFCVEGPIATQACLDIC